jgi:hypothetical protein
VTAATIKERAKVFWRCTCSHPAYEHGRRSVPNAGIKEYTGCRVADCPCGKYVAEDGSGWPPG